MNFYPDIMNTRQIAQYLGVHVNTIGKLKRTYRLPFVEITKKCVRFMKSDADRWLENRKVRTVKDHTTGGRHV